MRTPRLRRAVLAAILVSVLGLALLPPSVSAHAEFLSSTPSPYDIWTVPPTSVSVTVSEAVEPGTPTISVTASNGARVDVAAAVLSPTDPSTFSVKLASGLAPSVFTVTWSVISADDGHFTAGTFYFMLAYPDGNLPGTWPQTGTLAVEQPVSPVDVALESLGFLAFSIAFGGILLAALLWAPGAGELEPSEWARPLEGFVMLVRWAQLGAYAFALVAAARIVQNLVGTPLSGLAAALSTNFLLSLLAQYVIALVIVVLLSRLLSRATGEAVFRQRPWEFLPAMFLGFMLILLEVAVSHSVTSNAWWPLAPAADAAHLYGAALWVGGLLAVFRVRRWLREPTSPEFAQTVLEGFSRFAVLGVILVVSAGFVLGVVLVGTLDALVGTPYGWVVLAKGGLLVPMVAFGAWNRRTLRREGDRPVPLPDRVRVVARNVRTEAVLGAAVLVLAGLLVSMNPAVYPQPVNPQFILDTTAAGLYANFLMNPWPAGPGAYVLQLVVYYASNNTEYLGGGTATMSFLLEGGNGTAVTVPMEGPHGNHYVILDNPVLDAPGTWSITAHLRGPQGAPVDFPFAVTLHA